VLVIRRATTSFGIGDGANVIPDLFGSVRREHQVMTEVRMTDEVDETAITELRERVIANNLTATGLPTGRSLGCFLRDTGGQLIAGLDGFSWGGYAKIEWLWVRDDYRHHGLGTLLVRAAESEAADRGCAVVRVDSHTFQAPGFYDKLGYERIGFAADTPIGHGEVFFLKRLPG
jgi:ribosomal protein S18 acetylase RimI-like enzyme